MCNFLSAIVKRNGDIICKPDCTDSHEDLIDFAGLVDDGRGAFVRVELTPDGNDFANVDDYTFRVDQQDTPDWWTEDLAASVEESLRDRVRRMIIAEDRKIVLGGCWIVVDGATVQKSMNATIRMIGGTIKLIYGGTIERIDGGTIERIDGGTIELIYGGTIERFYGGTIERIYGGTIELIDGGTIEGDMR